MTKTFAYLTIALLALVFSCKQGGTGGGEDVIVTLEDGWKFNTGDDAQWADPVFDDSAWKPIMPNKVWEPQGWDAYDGFAWYRVKFTLPSSMKDNAFLKDSLQIILGMIDDYDLTYLNGKLIGINAKLVAADQDTSGFTSPNPPPYNVERRYVLPVNDDRILWDKENVIAVKVYDHGGGGGMYSQVPTVSMVDIKDLLTFDLVSSAFEFADGKFSKSLIMKNLSSKNNFSGRLSVKIQTLEKKEVLFEETKDIEIKSNQQTEVPFTFEGKMEIPCEAIYVFTETASKKTLQANQDVPYILTPQPAETPKITGAKIYGARPGNEFLFRVTATGNKPITFAAKDLPQGLVLNANSGVISGSVKKAGEYKVLLTAKNDKGEATRELKIVIGDKIALTPPMGWNSWNCWGLSVDDQKVRQSVDYMISTGLADHGWTYINIDDGWEAPERAKDGSIVTNEKFPDMKALSDYLHSKGFKFGIYSSPGPLTCGGYLGSYQHELQDAKTWASWGIDYIKYDWCSYGGIAKDNSLPELKKPYLVMRDALEKCNRDIVFSLCQYGMGNVWEWGDEVGGNLWRTTGDITDTWASLSSIGFDQGKSSPFAKPGNWNDPDMMILGWVGWGPSLHATRLSINEQYTHVSLWCLLAAPLLLGNDLSRLDDFTIALLTNDEVLDIDQDPLGKAAVPVVNKDNIQIWVRDLEDGSKAVGLFNLSDDTQNVTLNWSDIKVEGKQTVRDLWRQKDLGEFDGKFETNVYSHGVVFLKVAAKK